MKNECLFCRIIDGEIPSFTVYEDENFKVILDRFPASPGHMLILPKQHYKDIFELPDNIAKELYPLTKKIANRLKEVFHVDGINIVQNNGEAAGQSIYHFHLHLVPRYKKDGIILNQSVNMDTTLEALQEILRKLKEDTL